MCVVYIYFAFARCLKARPCARDSYFFLQPRTAESEGTSASTR
jgi:hypothetical protein